MTHLSAILLLCLSAEGAVVSFYSWSHAGKTMANGKPFDPMAMTCASWRYPLGTWITVGYRNKSVRVLVTDRGPAKRLNRDVDLSLAAFRRLEDPDVGLLRKARITR